MKAKIIFIFLLIHIALFNVALAQHTYAEWAKHIVATESTSFRNVITDGDALITNGIWVLDAEYDGIELPYHIGGNGLLVKKDLEGNILWHATIAGDDFNYFSDIALDSQNNILAAGWSSANDYIEINGDTIYVPDMEWTSRGIVAKFSGEDGSLIWFKIINPNEEYFNMLLNKVAVDADDNVYISGFSNVDFEIEGVEFPYTQEGWGSLTFLAKLDTDGSIVWGRQFHFVPEGNAGWSMARAMEVQNENVYFALQYSKPVIAGDDILPYQGNGDFDWIGLLEISTQDGQITNTAAFGSTQDQNLADLTFDNNGNLLVAGFFTSGSGFQINGVSPMSYGVEDGYVAKFNSGFELIWLRSMGSEFSSRSFNLSVTEENRIFVGGGFDSYTPLYFEGHKLIDGESPTNSLAMFQIVLDEDGTLEKAFALHGQDIYSIVEYVDAVVLDDDMVMAVGRSVDNVSFVEDSVFFSHHWAGFFIRWDLSKEFYKIFFDINDQEGNSLESAIVTLEGTINPFNKHSFYQIDPGVYSYNVTLEGFDNVSGEIEVIDQYVVVAITMSSTTTSVNTHNSITVSLFPNPANSVFHLSSDENIEYITISDLASRLVHRQVVMNSSIQINTQELPSGLYLVNIVTGSGMITKKLQIIK
jgi:hypothetical protein